VSSTSAQSEYQPGVCNIGGPEVTRRKQVAILGFALFIIFGTLAFVQGLSLEIAIFGFFPALLGSVGYIQSQKKFCFAYGLMGAFNFNSLGTISKVRDKEALAADRKMAITIVLQSIVLALALTGLLLSLLSL
jgi:hypothetical protein